jgi:hypothetical protein
MEKYNHLAQQTANPKRGYIHLRRWMALRESTAAYNPVFNPEIEVPSLANTHPWKVTS